MLQPRCLPYWPEKTGIENRLSYGDYYIVLKKKEVHQEYIVSILEIKDIEVICPHMTTFEGRHDRDCMVVGFTTTCAISAYRHSSCEFESRSWRGVLDTTFCDQVCQRFAVDLWFPPPIKLTVTIY